MNFHSPFPLDADSVLSKEKKIREWSEDNAGRISIRLIDSSKVFETKKPDYFLQPKVRNLKKG